MITGINHITLAVRDLTESLVFYRELLGFTLIAKWKSGAYLLAGNMWVCLTLDTKTRPASLPEYTHIAFDISPENFLVFSEKIKKSGVTIWKENKSEGDSLYFLDPNGHKLELHTSTLEARLKSCKLKPYEEMEFLV